MIHYLWVFFEKFGSVAFRIVAIMVLSRILTPEDFGVFAVVAVIISVGATLVDSGMGGALIRQADIRDLDYSTVFIFNLALSVMLAIAVWLSSQHIANFYKIDQVEQVAKALSIVLILKSISLIQVTKLTKELKFRPQAIIYLGSFFVSVCFAIYIAALGYGYWSLVFQQISEAVITSFLFIAYVRYFPPIRFSLSRFKVLFGFGAKLTMASVVKALYANSLAVIIGKKFDVITVGYFSQANKVNDIYTNTVGAVIEKASFPVLVENLGDKEAFLKEVLRLLGMVAFLCFFTSAVLAVCAQPIVHLLLGEQWIESAWMLSILSLSGIGMVIEAVTRSALKASGRADYILMLEIVKRPVSLSILVASIPFGLKVTLWCFVICAVLGAVLNMQALNKTMKLSLVKQFQVMTKPFFISMFLYLLGTKLEPALAVEPYIKLIVLASGLIILHFFMSFFLQVKEARVFLRMVRYGGM